MALDKELILKALTGAGLSEGLFDQITAESEDELATQIEELKKKNPPKKISLAELLKEAGLDENLENQITTTVGKLIESEVDKRVNQYVDKFQKKVKKGTGGDDEDDQIGELNKKIDALTEALTGQQKQAERQKIQTIAAQKLQEKGLPSKWLGRVTVEKEDQIDSVVAELETEFNEIRQSTADEILKNNPVPGFSLGMSSEAGMKARIDKFVESTAADKTSKTPVRKIGITETD